MKICKGVSASPGLVLGQVSRLERHVETFSTPLCCSPPDMVLILLFFFVSIPTRSNNSSAFSFFFLLSDKCIGSITFSSADR